MSYEIPTQIDILGTQFPIRNRGDYRTVLNCFEIMQDNELTSQEQVICALIVFYEDIDCVEDLDNLLDIEIAIKEMFKFFNCGQDESPGYQSKHKLIDWEQDSQLVCSAINNVAHTEIRSLPYLHWWTFMGYYLSVGESPLSTIVGIRSKIAKGKKLEKFERDFKRENPQYFTDTKKLKEDKELLESMWNIE